MQQSPFEFRNQHGVYYTLGDSNNIPLSYKSADRGLTWMGPIPEPIFYTSCLPLSTGNDLQIMSANYTGKLVMYTPSQDTFYNSVTGLYGQWVNAVFSNDNVLYASAQDGLYRSADGGETWLNTLPAFDQVWDMFFNGDTVFAGSLGSVSWSYDKGITWHNLAVPNRAEGSQDFATFANLNGRLIFSGNDFLYTDNFGATWDTLPLLPGNGGYGKAGAIIGAGNTLLSVSNDAIIFKFDSSTDEWDEVTTFETDGAHPENIFYKVGNIIAMCSQLQLLTSPDEGQTWTGSPLIGMPQYGIDTEVPRNIMLYNGLWIGSANDSLYTSSDQGSTWQYLPVLNQVFPVAEVAKDITIMNGIIYFDSYYSSVWRTSGNIHTSSGLVYRDLNDNGVHDAGEPGLSQTTVYTIPSGTFATTDTVGNYAIATFSAGDTLKPKMPVFFATVKPAYYLTTGLTVGNQDFGIYIPDNVADLSIDITNVSPFGTQPQGDELVVNVLNKGSLPQVATVQLMIDTGLIFITSNPFPTNMSFNGDTLVWVTDTLQMLQQARMNVVVSPYGTIGSPVICQAQVTPVLNDTFPSDNYAILIDSIVGTFDPNSKVCQQGESITPQQVSQNQELAYIVRFQNDGNAPAVNIVIADTLSPYLDLTTFHIISSSFPVTFNLAGQAIADFYFSNINLPPSSQNDSGSSGFVKYGVSCKNSLSTGNSIANTASIYFDNNPAIATNTTVTTVGFGNVSSVTSYSESGIIQVYPNPTNDELHVDLSNLKGNNLALQIYDVTGRAIRAQSASNRLETLSMNGAADGLYFGRILNKSQLVATFRFVISR